VNLQAGVDMAKHVKNTSSPPDDEQTRPPFWQVSEGAEAERDSASSSRLCFPWIADWILFVPLSVDRASWKRAYEQAKKFGLTEGWKMLAAKEVAALALPGQKLVQLWQDTQRQVARDPSFMCSGAISTVSLNERTLRKLFQSFLTETDCPGHAYHALLDSLRHFQTKQPIPADIRRRINEVCFLAGFIVQWGRVCESGWMSRYPETQMLCQQVREANRATQRASLLPATLKARMQKTTDIIIQLLQAMCASPEAVYEWKKRLGFDKGLTIQDQKHSIWTDAFWELGFLLRYYCPRRKPLHRDDDPTYIPDAAFKNASRLMHLACPELWPDEWTRAKNRYTNEQLRRESEGIRPPHPN
jgi:hypothetical protein